jgi:MFS family permease
LASDAEPPFAATSPIQDESSSDWLRVAAAFGALVVSVGPMLQFAFSVLLPSVSQDLGADRAEISVALAAGMVVAGAATPIAGLLMDRFGTLAVTLMAIPGMALAFAMIGFGATSVAAIIGLYALAGLFGAAMAPLPFAQMITGRFFKRRGLALGIAMSGVGLGAMLLPQLLAVLIDWAGWRTAYLGMAGMLLLVGLPLSAIALRGEALMRASRTSQSLTGVSAREALRRATFWAMAGAFFLLALACNGLVAHLFALLTDRGAEPRMALTVLSVVGAMVILGRLLSGALLDRLPPLKVAAGFFVNAALGLLLLTWEGYFPLSTVGAILVGLSLGAEVDLMAFLISRYFGRYAFGAIYGYLFMLFTLGSALGPVLMGLSLRIGSYAFAMTGMAAALLIAGAVVLRMTPPPNDKPG